MQDLFKEFMTHFNIADKASCVTFALDKLNNSELDVVTLYENILTPALHAIPCPPLRDKQLVWLEHAKSAIVRTIVECAYPYVLKEQKRQYGTNLKGRAVVLCPDGEYHELGARMAADFFALCGYETYFVGESTPKEEFVDVLDQLHLDCVGISVTNYFNLIATQKAIDLIRSKYGNQIKIIVGGNAFQRNQKVSPDFGVDAVVETFHDIEQALKGGS